MTKEEAIQRLLEIGRQHPPCEEALIADVLQGAYESGCHDGYQDAIQDEEERREWS